MQPEEIIEAELVDESDSIKGNTIHPARADRASVEPAVFAVDDVVRRWHCSC